MSKLLESIKDLYDDIPEEEAILAEKNLIKFFKILQTVDERLAHEKSNEQKNENIRSSN